MANLNVKTSKPAQTENPRSNVRRAPVCRRCGLECSCSEEEIDAGGPA